MPTNSGRSLVPAVAQVIVVIFVKIRFVAAALANLPKIGELIGSARFAARVSSKIRAISLIDESAIGASATNRKCCVS